MTRFDSSNRGHISHATAVQTATTATPFAYAGQSGPACAIKFNNYVNGEGLATDLVFWYRTGAFHAAGDLDDCHTVGPMLAPFGDWSSASLQQSH